MNKNKTEEKLPPQMQTVKNEAEQGDKSDGHHMSDVKSSAEDGSIVVEKNGNYSYSFSVIEHPNLCICMGVKLLVLSSLLNICFI